MIPTANLKPSAVYQKALLAIEMKRWPFFASDIRIAAEALRHGVGCPPTSMCNSVFR
jgi:hypothetical protein